MLRLTKREMERPLRGIARYGPSIRKRHKKNKIREKHEILRPRDMSPLRRSKNLKDLNYRCKLFGGINTERMGYTLCFLKFDGDAKLFYT